MWSGRRAVDEGGGKVQQTRANYWDLMMEMIVGGLSRESKGENAEGRNRESEMGGKKDQRLAVRPEANAKTEQEVRIDDDRKSMFVCG